VLHRELCEPPVDGAPTALALVRMPGDSVVTPSTTRLLWHIADPIGAADALRRLRGDALRDAYAQRQAAERRRGLHMPPLSDRRFVPR